MVQAHVPILILLANFVKVKYAIKTEEIKDIFFIEDQVKII